MSKAILVIDMPKYCKECIMCIEDCFCHEMCIAASERIFTSDKPDWCPLKPLPNKKTGFQYADGYDYCDGWNECIDSLIDT